MTAFDLVVDPAVECCVAFQLFLDLVGFLRLFCLTVLVHGFHLLSLAYSVNILSKCSRPSSLPFLNSLIPDVFPVALM